MERREEGVLTRREEERESCWYDEDGSSRFVTSANVILIVEKLSFVK